MPHVRAAMLMLRIEAEAHGDSSLNADKITPAEECQSTSFKPPRALGRLPWTKKIARCYAAIPVAELN